MPSPLSRLLDLKDETEAGIYEQIASEIKAGDANAAAKRLMEMALDETFYDYFEFYPGEDEYFKYETRMIAPTHAVRVLSLLGEPAHKSPLNRSCRCSIRKTIRCAKKFRTIMPQWDRPLSKLCIGNCSM